MYLFYPLVLPSVLWRCWLGGRKGIWSVKKLEWWVAGMIICLERDADLCMAQLMPLPLTISCSSKIQIGFTFLVPSRPGSPLQRAVNRLCVCVCVCVCFIHQSVLIIHCRKTLEFVILHLSLQGSPLILAICWQECEKCGRILHHIVKT